MPGIEIELNPVEFITIGTVGPKGQRVFYLQAGDRALTTSLIIEKEQSWALSEAINEFLNDLEQRYGIQQESNSGLSSANMELREPIEPLFRVAQMGLGYDENDDKIVLVVQEAIAMDLDELTEDDDESDDFLGMDDSMIEDDDETRPSIVRIWCTRSQIRNLSARALLMVESGRADPKQNGRIIYYWT